MKPSERKPPPIPAKWTPPKPGEQQAVLPGAVVGKRPWDKRNKPA